MAAKKTGAQKAAETRARRNPLTGGEPNSFTSTSRPMASPTNVQSFKGDWRERARLRGQHVDATRPGGPVDAQIGYRPPEGMSSKSFAWVSGAHHMLPNEGAARGTAAINEPHEHHPGVTVQRRAEDLSGPEYRKGTAVLAHYGHDSKDPVGSLVDVQRRNLHRTIGEHAAAGVEESSSHMFYGGRVSTEIPDQPEMDHAHYSGVMASQHRLGQAHAAVLATPQFQGATAHLGLGERARAAKGVVNQAVADTSPNNKWREGGRWPNIEQAEEASKAGAEGRQPGFIGGRIQNNAKSAGRTAEMLQSGQFETHVHGDPKAAAKTVAFRGALNDRDHTDSYKVSDVHEASLIAPGLTTSKSKAYTGGGTTGMTYIHPDHPTSATKGLEPAMDMKTGVPKQKVGLARTEEMLAKGQSYVHALNDHATRRVLSDAGLSRGVNYSDNVHAAQAATWGSQQMARPDVNVSHADQYPVVRDWGHEGVNVPNHSDVLGALRRGETHTALGPQFTANPNTKRDANTAKTKPYPVTP